MNEKAKKILNEYIEEMMKMTDEELINLPEPEGYEFIDEIVDMLEKVRNSEKL